MNNRRICEVCWESVRSILLIVLTAFLLLVNIFLIVFICVDNDETSDGSIIALSSTSSTGISLSTDADGLPLNVALLSFGYGQNISSEIASNNMNTLNFNLQSIPHETSFVMPRDGEITALSFSFTFGVDANLYNLNTRMIVKLYTAPANSEIFTAIPETTLRLDRLLNGQILRNEVITGSLKNLSVSIEEDTKLLLAIYIVSEAPGNAQDVNILGIAHAGINIK